ncbi:MAG TPA: phosphoglycerate mutase family protein [Longimicrobiales bacterium]|nr:phosphoglycerate mutase family protein [Longimicrobiales bacterium]
MKTKLLTLAIFLLSATAVFAQSTPTTVILVRHAEKEAQPANDPPLTAAGVSRAGAIAASLKDAGVALVITNQFARTGQTAQIIADSLHVSVVREPLADINAWTAALAKHAKAHGGHTIVIVGHSNTFGLISKAMGGPVLPNAPDAEYDNMYILTVQDGQPTKVIRAKQKSE